MIARLPGEKRNFMGDNLEIVCLFQAAEIERLIDNLDDFRLKYQPFYLDIKKWRKRIWIDTHLKFRLRNWRWKLIKTNPCLPTIKNLRNSLKDKLYLYFYLGLTWRPEEESFRPGRKSSIKISQSPQADRGTCEGQHFAQKRHKRHEKWNHGLEKQIRSSWEI